MSSKAAQDAADALKADRWRYAERCWAPIARKYPGASPPTFTFNIAFDASGQEIARGISTTGPGVRVNDPDFAARAQDPSENARREMHECLMAVHDLPVAVTPPGRNLDVMVNFRVP